MSLLDELLASLPRDAPVRSVHVGARMTAVCSHRCGLAATLADDAALRPGELERLRGASARELAQRARSDDLAEAAVGVAALNSLLDPPAHAGEGNASALLLSRGAGRSVALVGHFPFVPRLRAAAARLWVLEKRPQDGDLPAEAAPDVLPGADVVGITGSALVNHTLEPLLSLCAPQALVILLGPSAPLSPVVFRHGVSVVCGADIQDEAAALQGLESGLHFREFAGVRMVVWPRSPGLPAAGT